MQETFTLPSPQHCHRHSQLPDPPPPLHSQAVFTSAFQEPEHLVNHQINVCLSGFIVENTAVLHLTSLFLPDTFETCFPAFPLHALAGYEYQGSFTKEVFQPKPNMK